MQNTVYTLVEKPDQKKILEAVHQIIARVQSYVPGYRLKHEPVVDGDKSHRANKGRRGGATTCPNIPEILISSPPRRGGREEFARKLIQEGKGIT